MSKKTTKNNKKADVASESKKQGFIKTLWKLFGLLVVAVILFFGLLSTGAIGYLPNIDELENPIDRYIMKNLFLQVTIKLALRM